ncbi:MAG TPA: hypothetical protein VN931_07550 [Fibrobacteria bacterium]|nr:hypothetical protein [Fibrobacteria bacterium]
MRSTLAIFLVAAFLVGCDQGGTAPNGKGSLGAGGGGNGGGTGGGKTGGTTPDTTSSGLPIFDSVQLLGPVTYTGGTNREILFFLAPDRSLHIVASSDGANGETTVGRETIWDIQIESRDSLSPSSVTNSSEPPFRDSISTWIDSSIPASPENAVHFQLHSIVGAPEVRLATASNALLAVSIQAASGVNSDTALPPDSVGSMVRLGKSQIVAHTDKFAIQMPGGGSN